MTCAIVFRTRRHISSSWYGLAEGTVLAPMRLALSRASVDVARGPASVSKGFVFLSVTLETDVPVKSRMARGNASCDSVGDGASVGG